MFRLWVREWKDNQHHAVPVWLDATVRDFQRHARARFTRDAFVEEIDFDYLEIYVIEEDCLY